MRKTWLVKESDCVVEVDGWRVFKHIVRVKVSSLFNDVIHNVIPNVGGFVPLSILRSDHQLHQSSLDFDSLFVVNESQIEGKGTVFGGNGNWLRKAVSKRNAFQR